MGIALLSSILLGSAFAKALSKFLISNLGLNLYRVNDIPSFTQELAQAKTFDLADFVLAIIFTLFWFLVLRIINKSKNKLIAIATLIFSLIIFIQVNFSFFNLFLLIGFTGVFFTVMFFLARSKIKPYRADNPNTLLLAANGLLTGFFVMLVVNRVTTTILPLVFLLITPVFYVLFSQFGRYLKSYSHLLFIFAILIPTNVVFLLIVGTLAFVFIFKTKDKHKVKFIETILYPACFIILLAFNPLYYLGHLDSVEEGFWLGWLSGLRDGKYLYRDIASYHPPLILWVLNLFQKVVGYSIEHTRLALHILQIIGLVMYYFFVKKILKNKLSIFVVMLMALSLTTIMVRNNVEIRLGVGLLALAFLSNPLLSGVIAAVSAFTSIEVGLAAILASTITLVLAGQNRLGTLKSYLLGVFLGALPFILVLVLTGGLTQAFGQIGFYANAFSQGYFNLPIERSVTSAFIHWHIINQYISAYPFLWELSRGGIIAALIITFYKFKNSKLKKRDIKAIALSIFGLIVFRSALGRSDIYHLLFPLLVALPLIYFVMEWLNYKYAVSIFSILLVFVFARNIVNASFIEAKLFGLQTYGKAIGEQERLLTESQEQIVSFVKQNTSPNQSIFVFPWNPEIYFLAERPNTTKHYTPYAFFSESYQNEMISELENSKPVIIYNPEMIFGNLTPESLPLVNTFIQENYTLTSTIGEFNILSYR